MPVPIDVRTVLTFPNHSAISRAVRLRFDVKFPEEKLENFRKRISKASRDEDEDVESTVGNRKWELGDRLRRKGSIHSDTWTGTAAELASSEAVAVYPVTGWWKERHQLGKWSQQARYSLIVTLETEKEDIDLYTAIETEMAVEIEI